MKKLSVDNKPSLMQRCVPPTNQTRKWHMWALDRKGRGAKSSANQMTGSCWVTRERSNEWLRLFFFCCCCCCHGTSEIQIVQTYLSNTNAVAEPFFHAPRKMKGRRDSEEDRRASCESDQEEKHVDGDLSWRVLALTCTNTLWFIIFIIFDSVGEAERGNL